MTARERELALVVGAALLMSLPFLGAAFHVDEPFFLDRARELLAGTEFVPATWADRNNNPPMITATALLDPIGPGCPPTTKSSSAGRRSLSRPWRRSTPRSGRSLPRV